MKFQVQCPEVSFVRTLSCSLILCIVLGCFHASETELSSWGKDHMVHKVGNIYQLVLSRKSLPILSLKDLDTFQKIVMLIFTKHMKAKCIMIHSITIHQSWMHNQKRVNHFRLSKLFHQTHTKARVSAGITLKYYQRCSVYLLTL